MGRRIVVTPEKITPQELPKVIEEVEALKPQKDEGESFNEIVHKLRAFLNGNPDVKSWSARKHQLFNVLLNAFNE